MANRVGDYIVEILVVVDAASPAEAEKIGENVAKKIRRGAPKSITNVIVSEVRDDLSEGGLDDERL